MTIFEKICEHVQLHTGYKVTYANDENLDGEDRNETRGVLRVNTADRGYDNDAVTENFSLFIEFSVKLDEESTFVEKMRGYMKDWQSLSMDLEDGHIYKIYFQSLQPVNYVQRVSGVKFSTYVMSFALNLFDNAMFSDDVQIKIDDHVLQGLIQYSEVSTFSRDSHILGYNAVPVAVGCSKVRTYNLVFMPVIGNKASNALFNVHNNLEDSIITLGIKFPYIEDNDNVTPVVDRVVGVRMTSFSISLQKGTFGQVSVALTEYQE